MGRSHQSAKIWQRFHRRFRMQDASLVPQGASLGDSGPTARDSRTQIDLRSDADSETTQEYPEPVLPSDPIADSGRYNANYRQILAG